MIRDSVISLLPLVVPASCCELDENDNPVNAIGCQTTGVGVNPEACGTRIQSYFWVIGGVGIAILVIEVSKVKDEDFGLYFTVHLNYNML